MDPSKKKELIDAYKQREIVGGVYAIRCTASNRRMIDSTADLAGTQNRFDFSIKNNTCIHHVMQVDWKQHGGAAFCFEVLETVAKKEDESMEDYKKSLGLLRDCHRAEYTSSELYT